MENLGRWKTSGASAKCFILAKEAFTRRERSGAKVKMKASTRLRRAETESFPAGRFLRIGLTSSVAQLVKNPPATQATTVRFLGGEDPLEKGMATHSITLD